MATGPVASGSASSAEDSPESSDCKGIFAHAGDPGLQYVLMPQAELGAKRPTGQGPGGLFRTEDHGHLVTIVGRGGTGKSILSLQLVCQIVDDSNQNSGGTYPKDEGKWDETTAPRDHTAFYFTLESPHRELAEQAARFDWGKRFRDLPNPKDGPPDVRSEGVRIISAPAPTQDVAGLVQYIRQNIANSLGEIKRVVAVVIDPFGGVEVTEDLRHGLLLVRDLCRSHRVFLFLLVEGFLYTKYPWIEHYSETVIHLEHDPSDVPHRRLHIQKARHQRFYSGFHQFELHANEGFRLYPSLRAQAKGAHEELKEIQRKRRRGGQEESMNPENGRSDEDTASDTGTEARTSSPTPLETEPFFSPTIADALGMTSEKDLLGDGIGTGSVIFLMGPPGTFKQNLATGFALSALDREPIEEEGDSLTRQKLSWPELKPAEEDDPELDNLKDAKALYVSFKAEPEGVRRMEEGLTPCAGESVISFLDSRDPILTPEEVLFRVRRRLDQSEKISRAVIWGLRRLRDMPRFTGEKAVQFLEALVTLLTSRRITSLLIDWPDIVTPSQLPIVDLSQYIILTRVCHSHAWFRERISERAPRPALLGKLIPSTWKVGKGPADSSGSFAQDSDPSSAKSLQALDERLWQEGTEHVALLRVQRKAQSFVRSEGVILSRKPPEKTEPKSESEAKSKLHISEVGPDPSFEDVWNYAGMSWEEDPGLVEFGSLSQLRARAKA